MSIKLRLITMSFLQFYVWGAWLITIGTYCIEGRGWTFPEFGAVFSTLAISSLIMPAIVGVIADKWKSLECHTLSGEQTANKTNKLNESVQIVIPRALTWTKHAQKSSWMCSFAD